MELVQQLKLIATHNWPGLGHEWMERVASDAAYEIERLRAALIEQGDELAREVQMRQDRELSIQPPT